MASGHVNRAKRPNTWLHRPSLQREESSCQLGAVHTWHIAADQRCLMSRDDRTSREPNSTQSPVRTRTTVSDYGSGARGSR
jgi:hypothetical protein